MHCGEEIELELNGKIYFLQPDYSRVNHTPDEQHTPYNYTTIFDCYNYENPEPVFVGTTDEVLEYVFDQKYTLKNDLYKFKTI